MRGHSQLTEMEGKGGGGIVTSDALIFRDIIVCLLIFSGITLPGDLWWWSFAAQLWSVVD